MRIALLLAFALACGGKNDQPPAPSPSPTSPIDAPIDALSAEAAAFAATLREVAAFIEAADEARFIRLVEVEAQDPRARFATSGEWRILAGDDRTTFVTRLAALRPIDPRYTKACRFHPDVRVVARRGDREVTAELCFSCSQLEVGGAITLDIDFDGTDELRSWVRTMFADPTIGAPR